MSIFKNGVLSGLKRTDFVMSIEEMFKKSEYRTLYDSITRLPWYCYLNTSESVGQFNLLGIYPLTMVYDANFTVLSLLTGEIQKIISLQVKISWECAAVVNETTGLLKVVFICLCMLCPFSFVMNKLKYSIAWPSQRNGGDHFNRIELELGYSMKGFVNSRESKHNKDRCSIILIEWFHWDK